MYKTIIVKEAKLAPKEEVEKAIKEGEKFIKLG